MNSPKKVVAVEVETKVDRNKLIKRDKVYKLEINTLDRPVKVAEGMVLNEKKQ